MRHGCPVWVFIGAVEPMVVHLMQLDDSSQRDWLVEERVVSLGCLCHFLDFYIYKCQAVCRMLSGSFVQAAVLTLPLLVGHKPVNRAYHKLSQF